MEDQQGQQPKYKTTWSKRLDQDANLPEHHSLDYQSWVDPNEKIIWAAAAIGFAVAIGVVGSAGTLLAIPALNPQPVAKIGVIAVCLVVLIGFLLLWTRWLNRRGFAAGCALGIGFCLLCPVVAVLVICGNMRFGSCLDGLTLGRYITRLEFGRVCGPALKGFCHGT